MSKSCETCRWCMDVNKAFFICNQMFGVGTCKRGEWNNWQPRACGFCQHLGKLHHKYYALDYYDCNKKVGYVKSDSILKMCKHFQNRLSICLECKYYEYREKYKGNYPHYCGDPKCKWYMKEIKESCKRFQNRVAPIEPKYTEDIKNFCIECNNSVCKQYRENKNYCRVNDGYCSKYRDYLETKQSKSCITCYKNCAQPCEPLYAKWEEKSCETCKHYTIERKNKDCPYIVDQCGDFEHWQPKDPTIEPKTIKELRCRDCRSFKEGELNYKDSRRCKHYKVFVIENWNICPHYNCTYPTSGKACYPECMWYKEHKYINRTKETTTKLHDMNHLALSLNTKPKKQKEVSKMEDVKEEVKKKEDEIKDLKIKISKVKDKREELINKAKEIINKISELRKFFKWIGFTKKQLKISWKIRNWSYNHPSYYKKGYLKDLKKEWKEIKNILDIIIEKGYDFRLEVLKDELCGITNCYEALKPNECICGNELREGSKYCDACGRDVST